MPKKISVEEYLAKRSLSVRKTDNLLLRAAKPMESFDPEKRSAQFVMTDESVDSYGDEVKADGANLKRFKQNPIALRNHRYDAMIGTWSKLIKENQSILGTVTLAEEKSSPIVDETFSFMRQGILRAASIGFMPTEIEMKRDKDGNALWEFIIHEWELYECSVVSVPANANALAKSMAEGSTLCRDIIEEVLDNYAKNDAGLIVPMADFEKAHKQGSGNRTSIVFELKDLSPEFLKQLGDLAKISGPGHIEPEPDPIVKEIEDAISTFEKKVEELPEAESERKSLLTPIFDGIRSMFKTVSEPKKPVVNEPEPPALATPEEKQAAKLMLLQLEAEELAA